MRVLFLTHRLPYAPNRGDRVRAYHLLRQLRRVAEVDLLSLVHDDEEASHTEDLKDLASTVRIARVPRALNTVRSLLYLPSERPTTHTMLDAPDLDQTVSQIVHEHPPSVVLAYCSGMARLALAPPLRDLPLVLDLVDVDSAKWAALAEVAVPPLSWIYAREARLLARFESEAARHARTTLVVTSRERDTLLQIAPGAHVEVSQVGVDAQQLAPLNEPAEAPVVVFCGVMNYRPNEAGAEWLVNEVWPLVRRRRPDAQLQIVGSHPTRAVQRLASRDAGVTVTGQVPDVRPYLWGAAIAVAPLMTARGTQTKVLESVAAGLPTVITPVVLEGLPSELHAACSVANGSLAFADAIVALLHDSPQARRARARLADLAEVSWEHRLRRLPEILNEAIRRG